MRQQSPGPNMLRSQTTAANISPSRMPAKAKRRQLRDVWRFRTIRPRQILKISHISKARDSGHLARNQSPPKTTTKSKVLQHICASRLTSCCPCHENLHFEVYNVLCPPRSLRITIHVAQPWQCISQPKHLQASSRSKTGAFAPHVPQILNTSSP